MLIKAPEREYRAWAIDSRRWANYRPRPDDIVIATYPKCGTTWMQQIIGLLVFQNTRAETDHGDFGMDRSALWGANRGCVGPD